MRSVDVGSRIQWQAPLELQPIHRVREGRKPVRWGLEIESQGLQVGHVDRLADPVVPEAVKGVKGPLVLDNCSFAAAPVCQVGVAGWCDAEVLELAEVHVFQAPEDVFLGEM